MPRCMGGRGRDSHEFCGLDSTGGADEWSSQGGFDGTVVLVARWLSFLLQGYTYLQSSLHLAKFFSEGFQFASYWAITGMPTFLLELARNFRFTFEQALNRQSSSWLPVPMNRTIWIQWSCVDRPVA